MKIKFYKKLYKVQDNSELSDNFVSKHSIWCSKNWGWYFDVKPKKCESELFENFTLVDCQLEGEFKYLVNKIDKFQLGYIDVYFEFEYPSLLIKHEYLNECLK